MAVTWQRIPISFAQGLDTKSDPKQTIPGKLLELENGVFTNPGMVRKRRGLTSWTTRVEGRDRFRSGSALATHEDQLLLFTGQQVYTRLGAIDRWLYKGEAKSPITRTDRVLTNDYQQAEPDVGYLAGVGVYAAEDSRGGVRCSVVDADTRATILSDHLVSASGECPIVVPFADQLFVLYIDGQAIKHRRLDPLTPTSLSTESVLCNDVHTGSLAFDALPVGERLFFGYVNELGKTSLQYLERDLTPSSSSLYTGSAGPVALWSDSAQQVWMGFVSSSALQVTAHTYALSELMGATIVDPAPPGPVRNITGFCASGTLSNVYYEVSASNASDQYVMVAPADYTMTLASSGSITSVSQSFSSSVAPYSAMSFRGVNLVGPEWGNPLAAVPATQYPGVAGWEYWFPSTDDILYFESQGFNTIRMAVQWERVQPLLNGPLSSSYWNPWKSVANQALSRSMNVVLVVRDNGARYVSGTLRHLGGGTLTSTHFANLWTKLADEWKHDTRVIFDIMNEPDFDLGGSDHGKTWLTASNAAIAAIRATGATNPIWVPGHAYNNSQGFDQAWDGSKASTILQQITSSASPWYVTTHNYPEDSHGDETSPISSPTILRTRAQDVVDWCRTYGKQCVFGEFAAAYDAANAQDALTDFMGFCEENSDVVKGWCYWAAGLDYRNAADPQSAFTESAYSLSPIPHISLSGTRAPQIDWMEDWLSDVTTVTTQSFVTTGSGGPTTVSTAGDPSVWKRSVGLASKAWKHGPDHFLCCVHESAYQATYFTFDADGNVASKANPDAAGGLRGKKTLSHAARASEGVFRYANGRKGRTVSEGNTLFSLAGIASTELDFASSRRFASAPLARNLHVVGGTLGCFDGDTYSEHGFHLYPEALAAEVTGSGGSIEDGARQYVACYEWPDHVGQVHRSAPSIPVDVEVSGGSGAASTTITVPALRVTAKQGVQVAIYRTEAADTLFYKVTSPTNPLFNTSSADYVTFVDTLSDEDLISRELLYTDGGELANFPAPACSLTIAAGNRVWVAGLEDPNELRYSKLATDGKATAFEPTLSVRVPQRDGPVTALGALGQTLIAFTRSSVYAVTGEGLNNLGEGVDFRVDLVTTDVGCEEPNSVVIVNDGLMFKSAKGVYKLTSGFQVEYVGAPVEAFNGQTITSATLVDDANRVVFTTDQDKALVYDYASGQWSTFTNHAAADSTTWGSSFVLLRPNGVVAQEDPGSFADDGSHVKLKLVTGWLAPAGVQGYWRARKLSLLGEYKGEHSLRVRLGYDGNASFSHEATVDAEEVMGLTAYGDDSPYGSGTPYGGEFPLYQFEVFPKVQKCSLLRVSVEDLQPSSPNEGLTLSNLTLEVGLKEGGPKLAGRRRVGAS